MAESFVIAHNHGERRGRNLGPILRRFTDRQRAVYEAAKYGEREVQEFRELLLEENADSVEASIRVEVNRAGGNPELVALGSAVLALILEAAQEAAESIVKTYNYDLARAIEEVGDDVEEGEPEPTVETYRKKLFGASKLGLFVGAAWFAARSIWKRAIIAMTETAKSINFGLKLFYQENPQIETGALIVPESAVCPICIDAVARNPYPTIADALAEGMPAHNYCVHYVEPIGDTTVDTDSLWTGQDYDPDPGDFPF